MANHSGVVSEIRVENVVFSPAARPPASNSSLFLAGAGERGLHIDGNFIKFTGIGVYLEKKAVSHLSNNWKGKSAQELKDSDQFFRDIVTGHFEKLIQVTMITPLLGHQYASKVKENCQSYWNSMEIYSDAEAIAIQKFLEIFEEKKLPIGSSIFFTQLANGSLGVSFSNDGVLQNEPLELIESIPLYEAILDSIIGQNGVSPTAKESIAIRMSELLNETNL